MQTDIIGSHGRRLLEWLERYTFPAERAFADSGHAHEVAEFFVTELLRNGTTTALVMGSVHPASVDAIFAAAQRRGMRLIAGKVMMDRNCPEDLRDTARSGYAESKALIAKWHGQGRLQYAITPRFAPTSTPGQLAAAGRLAAEHPDAFVHTHLSENEEEVEWVRSLFPGAAQLPRRLRPLRPAAPPVGARARHLARRRGSADASPRPSAAVVHCPTCNLAMGSGLFDLRAATTAAGVRTALGTDVGGGTSFSLLRVMDEAYKVAQLRRARASRRCARSISPRWALREPYTSKTASAASRTGREADFVVLNPGATPLLARRTARAATLAETLHLLMTLGDERVVARTYVAGQLVHER